MGGPSTPVALMAVNFNNLSFVALLLFILRTAQLYRNRKNRITIYNLDEKNNALALDNKKRSRRDQSVFKRTLEIVRSCPSLLSYSPPLYLVSGLLQSAAGLRVTPPKENEPKTERETLHLNSMVKPANATCCPNTIPEGIVSIDWVHPLSSCSDDGDKNEEAASDERAPVAIAIPGLTGDSKEPYIMTVAASLSKQGFRVACFNPRGRGGNELKSPFLYCAGYTEDLRRVVKHVYEKYPKASAHIGIGFSLGSNYLAKFVGEEAENCLLSAAVCAGCPLDCLSMSNHFHNSTLGQLMDPVLVSNVQKVRLEYTEILKDFEEIDLEHVAKAKTMSEFDHRIIAPMFGFSCVSDYYRSSSAGNMLSQIRRPCLFLHAENDPIVPGKYIRMDNFRVNPYLIHCMTREGGHSMSWPMGYNARASWMSKVVSEFARTIVSQEKALAFNNLSTVSNSKKENQVLQESSGVAHKVEEQREPAKQMISQLSERSISLRYVGILGAAALFSLLWRRQSKRQLTK